MICYASVDRIEEDIAVCEVELADVALSKKMSALSKETQMLDIPVEYINYYVKDVDEGDILVLETEEDDVKYIYFKDEEEKRRRIDIIKELMKKK